MIEMAKTKEHFSQIRKLYQARLDTMKGGHGYDGQYMEPFYEQARGGGPHHFFVSYEGDEPAAFLQVRRRKPDTMHLVLSFTLPEYRDKGHARELLRKALETFKPGHVDYDISPNAPFDVGGYIDKVLEEYHGKG